jgi:hypothetical protein
MPNFNPGIAAPQTRQHVPLNAVVQPANSEVKWVPTVRSDECIEAIREKERKLNHDFSVENIEAEKKQLARLPATIKRKRAELENDEARLVELQSLVPHWDECVEIRRKHHQSTHSGRRLRVTPQERDEANLRRRLEKQADDDFIAPEDDVPAAAAGEKA